MSEAKPLTMSAKAEEAARKLVAKGSWSTLECAHAIKLLVQYVKEVDALRSAEQAARAEGAKQERAAVAAHLKAKDDRYSDGGDDWHGAGTEWANEIERGDHAQGKEGEGDV